MSIRSGIIDVAVVGGFESMSRVPHYNSNVRFGKKYGEFQVKDGLSRDGLTDPYTADAMGAFAVLCAVENDISRSEQDEYAACSYARAKEATELNKFKDEIVLMKELQHDEEALARSVDLSALQKLRPAFKLPKAHQDLKSENIDSVTPGNSSTMSDGASALVLTSKRFAQENNLRVLAVIKGWGNASQVPEKFTTSPKFAADKALANSNLKVEDIDFFEVNEAFAVVPIATSKLLGIDWRKNVNVYGGAVSMGHPLGCSGMKVRVSF